MQSKWIYWSFVPAFGWIAWIHAGVRAKRSIYFLYAVLYGLPTFLSMALSKAMEIQNSLDNALAVSMWFSLIGVIAHTQTMKRTIGQAIDQADAARTGSLAQKQETLPVVTSPPQVQTMRNVKGNESRNWYALIGSVQYGPFNPLEMRQLVRSGTLQQTDLVWRTDMKAWISGAKVKGLFETETRTPTRLSVGLGDVLSAKVLVAGRLPPVISRAFLVPSGSDVKANRLRLELKLPATTPIEFGYDYRVLFMPVECAAVSGNSLIVATRSPAKQKSFDLRLLKWSTKWLQLVIEAEGSDSITVTQAAKPFLEWLMPLVEDCVPKIPIGPPLPSDLAKVSQSTMPQHSLPSVVQTDRIQSASNQSENHPPVSSSVKVVSATTSAQLVDINNDSEESLAKLPGIGPILAKKAISNRQKNGGFRTVEDFAAALELKPHIIERLRTLVVVGEIADVQLPLLKGRVVDF